jgi:Cys-tRNA(Pro)/Cys-tRNA(Cys) deacylase
MASSHVPQTAAIRMLGEAAVPFQVHQYLYRGDGQIGVEAAEALGLMPNAVFKTVVFEGGERAALALIPADRRVAPGKLMRALGARQHLRPASSARAEKLTGYQVGGISPFSARRTLVVCVDESAGALSTIYVNGGRRGLMLSLDPKALVSLTHAVVAPITEPPRVPDAGH